MIGQHRAAMAAYAARCGIIVHARNVGRIDPLRNRSALIPDERYIIGMTSRLERGNAFLSDANSRQALILGACLSNKKHGFLDPRAVDVFSSIREILVRALSLQNTFIIYNCSHY